MAKANPRARARRQDLLEAMRRSPDRWTTGRAHALHKAAGWNCTRTVTRQDLRHLTAAGLLLEHGPDNDRSYSINLAKEANSHGWQTPMDTAFPRKHRPRRRW